MCDPSQPFPSPGSSFLPPGTHEFATSPSSKKDMDSAPDLHGSTPCNGATINGVAQSATTPPPPNGVVSPVDTRPYALLSFLRSFVPRFIVFVLNMPRFIWRVLQFQDPPRSPQPARDPHPSASDPQLSLPTSHHRLSTQSVTSLTSSRPAPPSPAMSRRTSGLSRASSRPVSGMSSAAPSRPVSGVHHPRSVSVSGPHPVPGITPLPTPITPTTLTPVTTPSVNPHDRRPNDPPTIPVSEDLDLPSPAEPTPTHTQAIVTTLPTTVLIQIRDYGFTPTDPRFSGQGPHVPRANRPAVLARRLASPSTCTSASSSEDDDGYETEEEEGDDEKMGVDAVQNMWEDVVDDGANGWGGFKWGLGRAWQGFPRTDGAGLTPTGAGFPSRGDLDRNFGGEDGDEDEEVEMEIDEESGAMSDEEGEGELPLFPGLYRALYAFEPEGTAEMKLDEDQLVRVIGRGGGFGWAVVVKDGLKDTGVHALVPESYLEPVRLDEEDI